MKAILYGMKIMLNVPLGARLRVVIAIPFNKRRESSWSYLYENGITPVFY
jgi:hypothetical protein